MRNTTLRQADIGSSANLIRHAQLSEPWFRRAAELFSAHTRGKLTECIVRDDAAATECWWRKALINSDSRRHCDVLQASLEFPDCAALCDAIPVLELYYEVARCQYRQERTEVGVNNILAVTVADPRTRHLAEVQLVCPAAQLADLDLTAVFAYAEVAAPGLTSIWNLQETAGDCAQEALDEAADAFCRVAADNGRAWMSRMDEPRHGHTSVARRVLGLASPAPAGAATPKEDRIHFGEVPDVFWLF